MIKTPILLLIFNRPDNTSQVFDAIKTMKPAKLYVAADGARKNKPGEKERCDETRKITENIDWPCVVKRLYRKNNLGCKKAVSSAIDWFFENEDKGIILEDDCLPDKTFFKYCAEMLKKYKNNEKVFSISGDNFLPADKISMSIYFTQYPHCWGWATWKRAWEKYDVNMADLGEIKNSQKYKDTFSGIIEYLYWKILLQRVHDGKIDTWDYQWAYTLFKNGAYSINPSVNLVKNIGFGGDATHTKVMNYSKDAKKMSFPIKYPKEMILNKELDDYTRKNVFIINPLTVLYQATMIILNK